MRTTEQDGVIVPGGQQRTLQSVSSGLHLSGSSPPASRARTSPNTDALARVAVGPWVHPSVPMSCCHRAFPPSYHKQTGRCGVDRDSAASRSEKPSTWFPQLLEEGLACHLLFLLLPPYSAWMVTSHRFKSEAFSAERDVAVAVAAEEDGNGNSRNGDFSFSKSESA